MTDLVAQRSDASAQPLRRDEFYVPGSLLKVSVDTSHPLAHGMPGEAIVFFDNSPVFRAGTGSTHVVAYYGPNSLVSGWAWQADKLAGGAAVAEATIGDGTVILYGPEVAFRAQPHGTFRLLFNGIFYGATKTMVIP